MKTALSVILVAFLSFLFSDVFFFTSFLRGKSSFLIEFLIFFTSGASSAFLYKRYPLKKFITQVLISQILALFIYCFAFAFNDYSFYFPRSNMSNTAYIFSGTMSEIRSLWTGLTYYPMEGLVSFIITTLSIVIIRLKSKQK